MAKRLAIKTAVCPKCGKVGLIRKIIRGYLFEEPDPNEFVTSGCVVSLDDPDYRCIDCNWEGMRDGI
jgi:predicted RNA-binding Zn-ribbon protein involved in translation (DUF1610 family)